MTHHVFPVLPIKHLVNQDDEPTNPQKLETSTKLQYTKYVLYFFVYCTKTTARVDGKAFNMCHQPQKGFWVIFVEIP